MSTNSDTGCSKIHLVGMNFQADILDGKQRCCQQVFSVTVSVPDSYLNLHNIFNFLTLPVYRECLIEYEYPDT